MTKFKFNGHQVTVENGKIKTGNKVAYDVISPLIKCTSSGPEEGDGLIILLISIFGNEIITDIDCNEDPGIIN
ncbi:hypothetical protein [Mucilaginibacter flavidus]|uniref:hypothetical protein n=1 Tax=Mucilaginibacter flavidus TaxID=2949309 RepID=UPI002093C1F6|nr:hypothetical protein [Mucilaginibacter flavidus]MCO5950500.1 hypothetical protein [Mucilaginibacter flavidus]